ncbi:MAG: HD-GYP domain-containing protein [Armatimonadetes bacterium]|nr:HD-GYP domain-containing protein [Armatimonadota bacterium]
MSGTQPPLSTPPALDEERPRVGKRPGPPPSFAGLMIYDAVLLLVAIAVLVGALMNLDSLEPLVHSRTVSLFGATFGVSGLVDLGLFALAAVIVNLWSLQMPGYGAVSVVDALYLGLLPVFGTNTTCLIVVVAGSVKAFRDLVGWRRPPIFVAYSFLHPVVSFGIGGLVYQIAAAPGPIFPSPPNLLVTLQDIGALGLAALVVSVLQASFSVTARVLHRGLRFYVKMIPLYRVRLYLLVLAPLGLLIAALYQIAPLGLVVLAAPGAMMYRTLKNYTEVLLEARATIEEMAEAVEKRDPFTFQHSDRVASYAEAIARELRLPEEEVEALVSAGKLHDLGKISVADCILQKMAGLSDDEYEEVKRHPAVGGQVAGKFDWFNRQGNVSALIRQHHEWYDGRGYPDRLKGGEILLGARILAVAEAWDTMTTDQGYREALPFEQALEQVQAGKGVQFDPEIVDAFVTVLNRTKEAVKT